MLVPELSYSCFQKWLSLIVQRAFLFHAIHVLNFLIKTFLAPLFLGPTVWVTISIFPWRAADVNALPITHLRETHGVSLIFIDTAG